MAALEILVKLDTDELIEYLYNSNQIDDHDGMFEFVRDIDEFVDDIDFTKRLRGYLDAKIKTAELKGRAY